MSLEFGFHMDPAELPQIVDEWMGETARFVVAERFWPTRTFHSYTAGESPDVLLGASRVWFSLDEFVFEEGDPLGLASANPSSPSLLPSRLIDEELTKASALSSAPAGSPSLKAWQRFRRTAKARMHEGTGDAQWNDGNRFVEPHHRYTDGALRLAKSGTFFVLSRGTRPSMPLQLDR
jgi:hypothetical protein